MAFIQRLSNTVNLDVDNNILTVFDITGNVGDVTYEPNEQGGFDEIINDTGYGVPNTLRTNISLFFLAISKTMAEDIILEVEEYNPLTVDEFKVKFNKDGWIQGQLISLNAEVSPDIEEYVEGNVVYDTVLGEIVTKIDGVWVITELKDLKDSEFVMAKTNIPIVRFAAKAKVDLNIKIENMRFHEDSTIHQLSTYQEDYNAIRGLLEAAINNFAIGNYYVFQKTIEHISSNHCMS